MSRLCKWFDGLHPTLKELIAGIFLWGILFGAVFVWFVSSKGRFLVGLVAGMFMAVGMAYHMYGRIEDSLELPQESAVKHMQKGAALRMAAVIAGLLVLWKLDISLPGAFLGIFALKLGAYTQPLLHKIRRK